MQEEESDSIPKNISSFARQAIYKKRYKFQKCAATEKVIKNYLPNLKHYQAVYSSIRSRACCKIAKLLECSFVKILDGRLRNTMQLNREGIRTMQSEFDYNAYLFQTLIEPIYLPNPDLHQLFYNDFWDLRDIDFEVDGLYYDICDCFGDIDYYNLDLYLKKTNYHSKFLMITSYKKRIPRDYQYLMIDDKPIRDIPKYKHCVSFCKGRGNVYCSMWVRDDLFDENYQRIKEIQVESEKHYQGYLSKQTQQKWIY